MSDKELELEIVDISIEDKITGEADERFVMVDMKYPVQDCCYCYATKLYLKVNRTLPDGTRQWVFRKKED